MPKTALFNRFVVDTVVRPGGRLMPAEGAGWRWEPARDERDLPDQLASLADAPDHVIARAVSRFGPLRLGASTMAVRESFVRSNVARDSVSMLSELAAAQDWYLAGMRSPEPRFGRAYVAAASALSTLPRETRAAISTVLDSGASPSLNVDLGASLVQLSLGFATGYAARPRPGSESVRSGFDMLDRILRGLAGIEPIPALRSAGGSGRIMIELLTSLPEFLTWISPTDPAKRKVPDALRDMAIETTADWRSAASYLVALRDVVGLARAAHTRGLSGDETQRLRESAEVATGWVVDRELRATEIAERLAPLTRATVEHELDKAGIWPVRQGVTTGAHWRALATLWEGLASERLPRLCATEGCNRLIGSRRNRLYCDVHRAQRQRERVRRARAAPTSDY
jgi:hypothetical protein